MQVGGYRPCPAPAVFRFSRTCARPTEATYISRKYISLSNTLYGAY
jgi:hypothetical protein